MSHQPWQLRIVELIIAHEKDGVRPTLIKAQVLEGDSEALRELASSLHEMFADGLPRVLIRLDSVVVFDMPKKANERTFYTESPPPKTVLAISIRNFSFAQVIE